MFEAASALAGAPSLCVGLAGWRARLVVDSWECREQLAQLYADFLVPDCGAPRTTISVHLQGGSSPRLRLIEDGRPGDFSALFTGPEGKRFVPIADPARRLFADVAVESPTATIELRDGELAILQARLWPLYLTHVLTWRMLSERPLVALHAAVCAVDRVTLIIVGPSGCGKSTLSWALAQQGADFFGDECAFLDLNEYRLHVGLHQASLRPGGVALLEALPDVILWNEVRPNDPKYFAALPTPKKPCPENPVLLFVDGFGAGPRLAPITGGEAAWRLARVMGCAEPSPLARLDMAADIVSRLPGRRLTIGRPQETAEMLLAYAQEYSCLGDGR